MVIEEDQEVIGSIIHTKELTIQVMKGKRTKRQRPTFDTNCINHNNNIQISPNISIELSESATNVGEEEQDMAHCLILLARGINYNLYKKPTSGLEDVYKCKTCNKCFSSFQALGGHRASHKKPKLKTPHDEEQKETRDKHVPSVDDQTRIDDINTDRIISTTLSLQTTTTVTKSVKTHECSICGAEFLSGQALGGHMRRHRPSPSPSRVRSSMSLSTNISGSPEGSQELNKVRTSLDLDLNVPAVPEEGLGLNFMSKEQVIVFSSSHLVNCRY